MHELFEHTADLGIRATAADFPGVLAEAAVGLTACLVDDPGTVRAAESHTFAVTGTDREFLLFDLLRELLYRFEVGKFLCARAAVAVTAEGLSVTAFGEPADPERHVLTHEVKAITYHGLTVAETPGGWVAEVIVDI